MNSKNELNYYLAYLQVLCNRCKDINSKKPDLWSSYMPDKDKDWHRREMLVWNCSGNAIAQDFMKITNSFVNYFKE